MRALGCTLTAGSALLAACTLITDVDRERIAEPDPPAFPMLDAGREDAAMTEEPDASEPVLDSGTPPEPDAAPPADGGSDAGDGG